jgi:hypothetical protein
MRLHALSALAELRPETRHCIYIPHILVPLAKEIFSPFFDVASEGPVDIQMQHLGLKHLLPGLIRGRAYHLPFHWILRSTRKKSSVKDVINDAAILFASKITRLSLPDRTQIYRYQGFMELSGLAPFRSVTFAAFEESMRLVLPRLRLRIHSLFPPTAERGSDVVFPSGTAHQIMPPQFGVQHFHNARFAFYIHDSDADKFRASGLEVVPFSTPEDIVRLISGAANVYSTDSFPFHLAQTWGDRCFMLLTEVKHEMTVVPGFPREQIIPSRAPCHPCRHRARINDSSFCDAGRYYCQTWEEGEYVQELEKQRSLLKIMP